MLRKRLLYLANERLLSVVWSAGKTLARESFAADEAGQIEFDHHLDTQPN